MRKQTKGTTATLPKRELRAVQRANRRTMANLSRMLKNAAELTFPLAAAGMASDVPKRMKPSIRKAHKHLLRAIDHLERALSEAWAIHDAIQRALQGDHERDAE